MEIDLKIFTLNCWGIPFISKDIQPRMRSIAEHVLNSDYDVVCLQEVWTVADYNLIGNIVTSVYPFSHYFYSGVVGSGVCVFSKHLLEDVFFHQWPLNGYIHKLQHGDWFAGKGIAMCRIVVKGFSVNVYTSHLLAEYNRTCDEYETHRMLQLFDTAQFIQLTSAAADFIVLAGDLNTEPGDLPHRLLMHMTGFTDAFNAADKDAQEPSYTNDGPDNSYTAATLLKQKYRGKRIDYILYYSGSNASVVMKKYCRPLPSRVPGCTYSYSDHEAITATFQISRKENSKKNLDLGARAQVLTECIDNCDSALQRLVNHKRIYWFLAATLFVFFISTIAMDTPFNHPLLIHGIRVIITILLFFTIVMATAWNMMEKHALLAGKLAMKVCLKQLVERNS